MGIGRFLTQKVIHPDIFKKLISHEVQGQCTRCEKAMQSAITLSPPSIATSVKPTPGSSPGEDLITCRYPSL
jgi:hypothetical protein